MKKYMSIALLCGVMAACMLFCSCGNFGGGREQIDNVLDKIYGTTAPETTAPEGTTAPDAAPEVIRYDYFTNDMAQFLALSASDYDAFDCKVGTDFVLTDEVFEEQLKGLLYKYATATNGTEQVTDQPIRFGDQAYIYYRGEVDGVAFEGGSNMDDKSPYKLGIGSGSFIPGFEEGLIGVVPAETSRENPFALHVTFPEQYKEELAGKDAIFYVVVEYVVQYDVPELTDAFVKDTLKYEPEDEVADTEGALAEAYLAEMRENMEQNLLESAQQAAISMAVYEMLDNLTYTALPEGEVDAYYNDYIAEFEYYYNYYKYMYGYSSMDEFAVDYMGLEKGADWKTELKKQSEEMVKQDVLVHAIAEKEGFEEISEQEFKDELDYLVDYYGGQYTAEYIRENMGDANIKSSVLFGKFSDYILEKINIIYED